LCSQWHLTTTYPYIKFTVTFDNHISILYVHSDVWQPHIHTLCLQWHLIATYPYFMFTVTFDNHISILYVHSGVWQPHIHTLCLQWHLIATYPYFMFTVTFDNQCLMRIQACKDGVMYLIDKKGPCMEPGGWWKNMTIGLVIDYFVNDSLSLDWQCVKT